MDAAAARTLFPIDPFAAIAATFPEKESLNGRRPFRK
jgi:hypothetical protein